MAFQYLEITEIYDRARQGRTAPFRCKAEDGQVYFVKGKSASLKELISEWLGAHLGQAFGLPIPAFAIAQTPKSLLEIYGKEAVNELGGMPAFASRSIEMTYEFTYSLTTKVKPQLQQTILDFAAWVRNDDRTLSQWGGNPNLIWNGDELYVIDHNLIFDSNFSAQVFHQTHVFHEQINAIFSEHLQREAYQQRMQQALKCWESAWTSLPEEWRELNDELCLFDQDMIFEQLQQDAQGALWKRLVT